jgi:uncharacterized membrane protein
MTPAILPIISGVTAVSTALIAGLIYAYSCSVTPGLGRLADNVYLSAMQSINRAILNPAFFASFMGTLILLPLATWAHFSYSVTWSGWSMLAATLIYVAGVFGVTVAGNVPLNNALDKADLSAATKEEQTRYRLAFEKPWNRLNTVRTAAAIAALVLVIAGILAGRS